MESIDALSEKLSDYLEPKQIEQVNKAFEFANEAHSGQFRTSGDPYVSHPIAVANILSSFHMDEDSLSAAMLHDVIEDCGVPKKVIEEQFNKNVANLVDGVSKLDQLNITSRTEAYAENFQKMILAMAKDIRVTLPKTTTADNTGPYDVELGFLNNKLWLFQIRPFVENDNAKSSEYLKSISPEVDGSKTISLNTTL